MSISMHRLYICLLALMCPLLHGKLIPYMDHISTTTPNRILQIISPMNSTVCQSEEICDSCEGPCCGICYGYCNGTCFEGACNTTPQCHGFCENGPCYGQCLGGCQSCTSSCKSPLICRPDQICEGVCGGICDGDCTGQCAGACNGTMTDGFCDGFCSGDGACLWGCDGICSGTCYGSCAFPIEVITAAPATQPTSASQGVPTLSPTPLSIPVATPLGIDCPSSAPSHHGGCPHHQSAVILVSDELKSQPCDAESDINEKKSKSGKSSERSSESSPDGGCYSKDDHKSFHGSSATIKKKLRQNIGSRDE